MAYSIPGKSAATSSLSLDTPAVKQLDYLQSLFTHELKTTVSGSAVVRLAIAHLTAFVDNCLAGGGGSLFMLTMEAKKLLKLRPRSRRPGGSPLTAVDSRGRLLTFAEATSLVQANAAAAAEAAAVISA